MRWAFLAAAAAAGPSSAAGAASCARAPAGEKCEEPKYYQQVDAASADDCCNACGADAGRCQFWSYRAAKAPAGVGSWPDGGCRLFDAACTSTGSAKKYTSGSAPGGPPPPPGPAPPGPPPAPPATCKAAPPGTKCEDHQYKKMNVSGPEECCAQCGVDAGRCLFWSYRAPKAPLHEGGLGAWPDNGCRLFDYGCVTIGNAKKYTSGSAPPAAPPTPHPPTLPPAPPGTCGPADDAGDCAALISFATALNYMGWRNNDGWLRMNTSVCDYFGVTCVGGRVTELSLHDNQLDGKLPGDMAQLTELVLLNLNGQRPHDYMGCGSNNLHNSSISALFGNKKLNDVNLEYSCLGGTLDGIDALSAMDSLQIHGNYISGTIPSAMGTMTDLTIMKLGRNPLSGSLPAFTTLNKLVKFNCNFCSLSGEFPDVFGHMPDLEQTFWIGNAFTGTLPASLGLAKKLAKLSFSINSFSGQIPASICDIPSGSGGDCRIGADTDIAAYQATYPWVQPVNGNMFDCPVPKCASTGSCNKTKDVSLVGNPPSYVKCAGQ